MFTRKHFSLLGSITLITAILFSFNLPYTAKVSAAAKVATAPKVAAAVNISCPPTQNDGANNDWVTVIQYRLNSLHFNEYNTGSFSNYPLATDGSFGPNTYNAVVSFQSASGLTPDGSVGPLTWSMMGLCTVGSAHVPGSFYQGSDCPPTQNEGDNNTFVNALQHLISETAYYNYISQTSPYSGWYPLQTDGSFGPNTLKGVYNFQAGNNLTVDGSVGPLTWNAMGMCYAA